MLKITIYIYIYIYSYTYLFRLQIGDLHLHEPAFATWAV